MDNKKIKQKLIAQYGRILGDEAGAFRLYAESEEKLLEVDTTKVYIVEDFFNNQKDAMPTVDILLKAFTKLCQDAKIFVDQENVQAAFVGDGSNKFDFLRIPIRGVVVNIAVLPSPMQLGEIALAAKSGHAFAIVHICRDDTEIQSQGNEFVSQTLNMETGQVHTCLFRMGVTTDQPLFPSYVPVLVCPKGYNNPQDAVDNQAEDVKNLIAVADFKPQ